MDERNGDVATRSNVPTNPSLETQFAALSGEFSAIKQQLDGFRRDVQQDIKALSDSIRDVARGQRTPWGTIGVWAGILITLTLTIVGFWMNRATEDQRELKAVNTAHAEKLESLSNAASSLASIVERINATQMARQTSIDQLIATSSATTSRVDRIETMGAEIVRFVVPRVIADAEFRGAVEQRVGRNASSIEKLQADLTSTFHELDDKLQRETQLTDGRTNARMQGLDDRMKLEIESKVGGLRDGLESLREWARASIRADAERDEKAAAARAGAEERLRAAERAIFGAGKPEGH